MITDEADLFDFTFNDELVMGTVTEISQFSTLIRGDVTYAVTVALEPSDLPLRWGMMVAVDIE